MSKSSAETRSPRSHALHGGRPTSRVSRLFPLRHYTVAKQTRLADNESERPRTATQAVSCVSGEGARRTGDRGIGVEGPGPSGGSDWTEPGRPSKWPTQHSRRRSMISRCAMPCRHDTLVHLVLTRNPCPSHILFAGKSQAELDQQGKTMRRRGANAQTRVQAI